MLYSIKEKLMLMFLGTDSKNTKQNVFDSYIKKVYKFEIFKNRILIMKDVNINIILVFTFFLL